MTKREEMGREISKWRQLEVALYLIEAWGWEGHRSGGFGFGWVLHEQDLMSAMGSARITVAKIGGGMTSDLMTVSLRNGDSGLSCGCELRIACMRLQVMFCTSSI